MVQKTEVDNRTEDRFDKIEKDLEVTKVQVSHIEKNVDENSSDIKGINEKISARDRVWLTMLVTAGIGLLVWLIQSMPR